MNIKYFLGLGLITAVTLAGAANAAVITLESVTPSGDNNIFSYQGSLGGDEGVRAGDRLVIYDFAGYVAGSIFADSPNLTTTTEFTTMGPLTPGQTDSASLVNLIFTYTGPDFRNEGGPFVPFDFDGFGAVSIFRSTVLDAFTTITTKNNPDAAENTALVTLGETSVPNAVPEPASWAMLIVGFGLVGATARRRRHTGSVAA